MNTRNHPTPERAAPRRMRRASSAWLTGLLAACVLGSTGVHAAEQPASSIPEREIAALRQDLADNVREASTAQRRRVVKNVIRQARKLIEDAPDAANRFAVLGLIHDSQRQLLTLENTAENRDALFATAQELLKAPDEFAELRLGADLLLMEKAMGEKNATVGERVKVLEELLESYRDSSAEWKGLMIGSMIATKLLDLDLVDRIKNRMADRFAGDHRIIHFWRSQEAGDRFDAIFQGTYQTADGATLSLPLDRWGHQYLVFFWSQENPRIDDHLREAKELQAAHPGGLEVLSFNLDKLPDAGLAKLKSLGLDWTVLHLPEGREHPAYKAYAGDDPQAFLINAQGRLLLDSPSGKLGITAVQGVREEAPGQRKVSAFASRLDDNRYLAQLRSLSIGDFLVADAPNPRSIPAAVFEPIQACFVPPPFRFRLSPSEELANYRKAADLCDAALATHADSPDAWTLRNRRIIALLGIWNLSHDAKHLEAAVTEANLVLEASLPPGADVVARFCLAMAAMRHEGANPEAIIATFLENSGADKAPPPALAAAAILALKANARSIHEQHRSAFLNLGEAIAEGLWPVRAFLMDSHHGFRNFNAVPGGLAERRGKSGYRVMVSALDQPLDRDTRVAITLKKTDGSDLTVPRDLRNRITGVIFIEPSADADAQKLVTDRARRFAGEFKKLDTEAVVVVLGDDAGFANSLVPEDQSFQVAMLPGGLNNPFVRKHGILCADRMPNIMLFRPNGTLAWQITGLTYRAFEGPDLPVYYGILNNVDKVKSDAGFEALERGDYKGALKAFDDFVPHHKRQGDWWFLERDHGRVLAHMGLKEWEAALKLIEPTIARGKTPSTCKCHGIVEMLHTKAMILEALGRGTDAEAARALIAQETLPHVMFPPGRAFRQGVPVGVYYDWLKKIRLAMEEKNSGKK